MRKFECATTSPINTGDLEMDDAEKIRIGFVVINRLDSPDVGEMEYEIPEAFGVLMGLGSDKNQKAVALVIGEAVADALGS